MYALCNGAKTKTVAPQNDRAMEWNVNFFDRYRIVKVKVSTELTFDYEK